MRSASSVVCLVLLCACGDVGVDDRMDGALPPDAAAGPSTDASRDRRGDAAADASTDATLNPTLDASLDATPNAMLDATTDAALDAALDGATDAAVPRVSLDVTLVGSGSGSVSSTPVGITCDSGTCSAQFDQDTLITLSANATTGSGFTGWSGACTGTSDCVVSLDGAKGVTATFDLANFTLQVTKSGDGFGTVTGNGVDCGGTCTVSLPYGTVVTLTSSASSAIATLSTPTGWSGAGCSGTNSCMFTITADVSVDAAYKLAPNLMFTTSSTFNGNLGGLVGADTKCQALANAQSLGGTYRAYLGATSTAAPTRFAGASGWTRVDGAPLVNAIGDFGKTTLQYAPVLDQAGNDLSGTATVRVWTATQADTNYFGQNCNAAGAIPDWTSTTSQTMTGLCTATDANVLVGGSAYPCSGTLRLYCFGVDRAASIP